MGHPAQEVITLAAELRADLVVIGSGGPSPLRRAMATTTRRPAMGRAAEAIVRTAPCPVLVVCGDEISKDAALGEALSDTKEGD